MLSKMMLQHNDRNDEELTGEWDNDRKNWSRLSSVGGTLTRTLKCVLITSNVLVLCCKNFL